MVPTMPASSNEGAETGVDCMSEHQQAIEDIQVLLNDDGTNEALSALLNEQI